MKTVKFLLFTFLVSLFSISVFAQEAEDIETIPAEIVEPAGENEINVEIVEQLDENETDVEIVEQLDENETDVEIVEQVDENETNVDVLEQIEDIELNVEKADDLESELVSESESIVEDEKFIETEPFSEDEKSVVEEKTVLVEKEPEIIEENPDEIIIIPIDDDSSKVTKEVSEKQRPKWIDEIFNSDVPFFNRLDFVFGFTPTIYLNAQDKTLGAPSPIVYPIYFGFHWPNNTFISFQPSFKFFKNYYLVNDGMVLPAEMEHRVVDAWSCIFNVPVVVKIDFWDKFNFKAFGGLAFLIRIPTLATGIEPTDYGYYGTAEEDYKYIKKWLVNSWRFLYLSAGTDVMFKVDENLQIGPELSIYFPIGAVFSDWTFDALMVSVGFKVAF